MRRMGFSSLWPDQSGKSKLAEDEVTTLRFPRRDKDWLLGETVLVVYRPRHDNVVLGMAIIRLKEPRSLSQEMATTGIPLPTEEEAVQDGFQHLGGMLTWFWKVYRDRVMQEAANKLTIRWEYPARTRERLDNLRKLLKEAGK